MKVYKIVRVDSEGNEHVENRSYSRMGDVKNSVGRWGNKSILIRKYDLTDVPYTTIRIESRDRKWLTDTQICKADEI